MNIQFLMIPICLIGFALNVSAEERIALVIGNSSYATAPLKNPVNDATDIATKLQGVGFQVTRLLNASHKKMKIEIRKFSRQLGKKGTVGLFYYAGHGVQFNNRNYLIPVDAEIGMESEIEYESIDVGRVLSGMRQAGNGLNLVILDACRNNPFERSFRDARNGLARMSAPKGSLVLYATSPGDVAQDGSGRNGIFTKHLLRNIDGKGLAVEQVFKKTALAVSRETGTKQVPWIEGVILGEFYFGSEQAESVETNTRPISTISDEALYWSSVKDTLDPEEIKFFLAQFPKGRFAGLANLRLKKLSRNLLVPEKKKDNSIWRDPKLGIEFVFIPKGCFQMGSPHHEKGRDGDEVQHQVCLKKGFWMSKYEVTNKQFRRFRQDHDSKKYKGYALDKDQQPAVYVSWQDATAFAEWMKASTGQDIRLPSEAEWEYAARGKQMTIRYWGDDSIQACHFANVHDEASKRQNSDVDWESHTCNDHYVATAPVGQFKPNAFGLHDMLGNAWEWTCSEYHENYQGLEQNCRLSNQRSKRTSKGGGWSNQPKFVRAASRDANSPNLRFGDLGFRLVRQ